MSIKRIVGKETELSLAEYEAESVASSEARKRSLIGQLVIDIDTNPALPTIYLSNNLGYLNQVSGNGPGPGGGVNQIIAGNNIIISPASGQGNVTISAASTPVDDIPAVYFVAPATANNQVFTSATLLEYTSNTDITLFLNGVLLENTMYTLSGSNLTVNVGINIGDSIAISRAFVLSNSTGGTPGGLSTQLQFNNGGIFGGVPIATFDGSNLSLGSNATLKITGGTANQFLRTDGTGNLSWAVGGGAGGNLIIIGRTGDVIVPTSSGTLIVVGRTGDIPVPLG
jgi:hypothetical protein